MEASRPTSRDLLENGRLACTELRAQIDHQVHAAESMDTKAWALITAIGVIAGVVAPRVGLTTAVHAWSALVVFAVALITVGFCLRTIWPQTDFSFGPDPDAFVKWLAAYDRTAIALSTAEAMAEARQQNLLALQAKRTWFIGALIAFTSIVGGIGWLVYVGAIS